MESQQDRVGDIMCIRMLCHRLRRLLNIKTTLVNEDCLLGSRTWWDVMKCLLVSVKKYPANTGHSPNAVSMLVQRLRRWPNIETALGVCWVCGTVCVQCLMTVTI